MSPVQRIKALAGDTGHTVWFGHDANQFASCHCVEPSSAADYGVITTRPTIRP